MQICVIRCNITLHDEAGLEPQIAEEVLLSSHLLQILGAVIKSNMLITLLQPGVWWAFAAPDRWKRIHSSCQLPNTSVSTDAAAI